MSRPFNDTTNLEGLVQKFEEEMGYKLGDISGNTTRLKQFTSKTRSAFDRYLSIAIPASGTWQFDDSNHTDYPIIKGDLVSGQRDYTFTVDEDGNLILDIYKVAILPSETATEYQELEYFDEMNDRDNDIVAESSATGTPSRYGRLANGIFLETPTSYNASLGLKMFINREGSYFVYTDTTKKPGVPGNHHDYFYLYPSYLEARKNNTANVERLKRDVMEMERQIEIDFSKRSKDERPIMRGKKILYI